MKKLIVLFVALALATTAFAADWSFSWDTDFGWTSNFDDNYSAGFDELELGIAVDIDEYNSMSTEFDYKATAANDIAWDGFKLTTDLGAYLGLSGVGVELVSGIQGPEGEEYSDFGNANQASAGYIGAMTSDAVLDVNLDFGSIWASVASNMNFMVDDLTDSTGSVAMHTPQMLFLVGSTSLVEGLSFEAGAKLTNENLAPTGTANDVAKSTIIAADASYTMAGLTVGGSFSTDTEADTDGDKMAFGAGALYAMDIDDMTSVDASVSFSGNDDVTMNILGGGVSLGYGDFGADIDFKYNMDSSSSEGLDASAYVNIGAAQYRLGYMTDAGWSSNANGAAGAMEGGIYMVVTCDF